MFPILLVAFLAVPILEIYLLFQVGGVIGAGWTILIVIGTAILGAYLLRQQGLSTWTRLNEKIAQGQLPPTVLVEGIFLLLAGAFLLTPGFFTDTIGFLFLVPPVRQALAAAVLRRGVFMATHSHTTYTNQGRQTEYHETRSPRSHGPDSGPTVIEGEYEDRTGKD